MSLTSDAPPFSSIDDDRYAVLLNVSIKTRMYWHMFCTGRDYGCRSYG